MTSTVTGTTVVDPPCTEAPVHAVPPAELPAFDLVIAPMRRRHLRSIVRIQAADPHLGWSVGLWIAELRRESDRVYVVAQVGRETVGYAGLLLQDEDAHITTIGVAAAWQQRGIATRLLLHVVDAARVQGAQNLTLEVRASNEAAIALYRRFGLAPAGVRKNYYADLGEDALVMWAHEVGSDAYGARLDGLRRQTATAATTTRATPPATGPVAGPGTDPERREGTDDE